MAEDSMEILKITSNPDTPTFENTIAALELTGSTYLRVFNLFNIWSSNMNTPEFQIIDTEMQPIIAAFNDQINQNEALFKRIEVVYNSPEKQKLTSEQQRLVWKYYTDFVYNGAQLDAAVKKKLQISIKNWLH